jgi:hypothetical protein
LKKKIKKLHQVFEVDFNFNTKYKQDKPAAAVTKKFFIN